MKEEKLVFYLNNINFISKINPFLLYILDECFYKTNESIKTNDLIVVCCNVKILYFKI
jgi:hypothetical protein